MTPLLLVATLGWGASQDADWLRSTWDDAGGTLEVASRHYAPSRAGAPEVLLVGVTHIGDAAYYESLKDILDGADLVIFESVLPEGGTQPGGESDDERASSTTATGTLLAAVAAGMHRDDLADWNAMIEAMRSDEGRMGSIVAPLGRDGWGRPWEFDRSGEAVAIVSRGADGRVGGESLDADLVFEIALERPVGEGTQLQREMADMLSLSFQLDALPYDAANWVPGDMRIDEVAAAFEERGQSIEGLSGMLSGSGLMGSIAVGIVRVVPALDALLGGRVSDAMRVMLIDMLGDESMVESALEMQGPAFTEVLLHLRNLRALDVLEQRSGQAGGPGVVAVLYGAGHMPHMADVLERDHGYMSGETTWLPAIGLNYDESAMSVGEVTLVRSYMRSMSGLMGR